MFSCFNLYEPLTPSRLIRLFVYNYRYSQIRAPEFAKFAADTIGLSYCKGFVFTIHFKNIFGAKMGAYAASFAPFPVHDVFL